MSLNILARTYATAADKPVTMKKLHDQHSETCPSVRSESSHDGDTHPSGMIHISFNLDGVKLYATLLNSSAGVKRDTLMTFSLRCVALSVTPLRERM